MALAPAIALLAASALLLAGNLLALARTPVRMDGSSKSPRWAVLAYAVIGAMIEYAFLRDHLSGGPLVVLTLSLAVFVVHVPVLIGSRSRGTPRRAAAL